MSRRQLRGVFEPSCSSAATDAGLGLIRSHEIVERHGDRIEGQGARFISQPALAERLIDQTVSAGTSVSGVRLGFCRYQRVSRS